MFAGQSVFRPAGTPVLAATGGLSPAASWALRAGETGGKNSADGSGTWRGISLFLRPPFIISGGVLHARRVRLVPDQSSPLPAKPCTRSPCLGAIARQALSTLFPSPRRELPWIPPGSRAGLSPPDRSRKDHCPRRRAARSHLGRRDLQGLPIPILQTGVLPRPRADGRWKGIDQTWTCFISNRNWSSSHRGGLWATSHIHLSSSDPTFSHLHQRQPCWKVLEASPSFQTQSALQSGAREQVSVPK